MVDLVHEAQDETNQPRIPLTAVGLELPHNPTPSDTEHTDTDSDKHDGERGPPRIALHPRPLTLSHRLEAQLVDVTQHVDLAGESVPLTLHVVNRTTKLGRLRGFLSRRATCPVHHLGQLSARERRGPRGARERRRLLG